MKVYHRPDVDYLSIDFKDESESKSVYENGIILRYNKTGEVIGLDITDSTKFFLSSEKMNMKQACKFLGVSDSTMRRMIKAKKISASKKNKGKDYVFKKSDLVKLKMGT